MDIFMQASKLALRFNTTVGPVSSERLWELPLTQLDTLAVSLEEQYEASKGKSFLVKKTKKNKVIKLQFDIVLAILNQRVDERDTLAQAKEVKAHNESILARIQAKKESELDNLSVKELEKLLKK